MSERKPVVVLDPGHGGDVEVGGSRPDSDPSSNGLHEKNLTLDLARRVAALLEGDARVVLTRTSDVNLGLAARAAVARDNQAAVFVSIHFNGWHDPAVNGTEAFVAPGAPAPSRDLAQALADAISSTARISNRGVREHNWGVIRRDRHHASTAACLLEVSFLSNPQEAQRLAQDSYRQDLAQAIAGAIRRSLGRVAVSQSLSAAAGGGYGLAVPGGHADTWAVSLSLPSVGADPLDPGTGGRAIHAEALVPADLVIISSPEPGRPGGESARMALYVGEGMVAQAHHGPAELKPLKEVAAPATVVAVLRHPQLSAEQAARAARWAREQAGRSFTYRGVFRNLQCRLDPRSWCSAKQGSERERCLAWRGAVNLGAATGDGLACSQLVLAAYEQAGVPLTASQPNWDTAGDIALQPATALGYVGHLKAPGAVTQQLEVPLARAAEDSPATTSRIRFLLQASVGRGGTNNPQDVAALKDRLRELGFDWLRPGQTMDADTIQAIKLFQSIVQGHQVVLGDGRVDVPGPTYRWLQDSNAPRWQTMPTGSRAEGFYNAELADTSDHHDYGTNWLANTITAAAAHYRDNYLGGHSRAALLTVNDTSLPHGGRTPDHSGHQTGLCCDLRLPRKDGRAGGITWRDTRSYDQAAARAQLQALRAQPLVSLVYFNDPVLIRAGLCRAYRGHDNHIHFQIRPDQQQGIQLYDAAPPGDTAVAGVEEALAVAERDLLEPAPVADERFAWQDQGGAQAWEMETGGTTPVMTVVDGDARIRTGPPEFAWDRPRRIPQYTKVRVLERQGDYARVEGLDGTAYGWTAYSNLGTYYKDDPALQGAALAPAMPVTIDNSWPARRRSLAATYNRLGGLIEALAGQLGIEPAAVLAVWYVESGGRSHTVDHALIRFENHLLWRRWGAENATVFDQHFQFGTRPPQTGQGCDRPWRCHKFRAVTSGEFQSFHGNQTREYEVLALASRLAGENTALQCISIGGPQILVSHYRILGYGSPREMYDAFQAGERAHVLGFFDYCQYHGRRGRMIQALRDKDWRAVARGYNGSGQVTTYAGRIQSAYDEARRFLPAGGGGSAQSLEQDSDPYQRAIRHFGGTVANPTDYPHTVAGFQEYLTASGVRHFTAQEMTRPHNAEAARQAGYSELLPDYDYWPRGAALALIADQIRDLLGEAVVMRNWWRPEAYNRRVGGAEHSDHLTASAVDLDYRSSQSRQRAEEWLWTQYHSLDWLQMSLGLGARTTHVGILSPRGHRHWYYQSHPDHGAGRAHSLGQPGDERAGIAL